MNRKKGKDPSKTRLSWRLAVVAGILVVIVLLGHKLSVDEWMPQVRDWINAAGPWGPVAFILLYVGATNVGAPGTPLTVSAGAVFGAVTGLAVSIVASTLSACTMFLISRRLGQDTLKQWIGDSDTYRQLEVLLSKHGAWIVVASRLVPFPFLALNYSYGLTPVPFWTYAIASALGMIPMNALFVFGGDAIVSWLEHGYLSWTLLVLLLGTALLAAAATWQAYRLINRD